jgi:hypothetical protein
MFILYKLAVDSRVFDEITAWRMDFSVDVQRVERDFIWSNTHQRACKHIKKLEKQECRSFLNSPSLLCNFGSSRVNCPRYSSGNSHRSREIGARMLAFGICDKGEKKYL